VGKKILVLSVICFCIGFLTNQNGMVQAAEIKIGVMNSQKVLWTCRAGAKVKAELDAKVKKYQQQINTEEENLSILQNNFQKMSSVWSVEQKDEMALKYNQKKRDLQAKKEDAQDDINQMRANKLQPLVEQIRKELEKYGKEHGYTVILDSANNSALYFNDSIDITDDLIKSLDKNMAK
jgi:outer membrane protein